MPNTHPILFYLLAAYILASGWGVVRQRNLFHAGISLISCFMGVAGVYVTLGAPFLAGMQVLIYAGAIAVVLLFAFMLTRELMRSTAMLFQPGAALAAALSLGAILIATLWNSTWFQGPPGFSSGNDVVLLGQSYMTTYLVPFQLVALLLLITLMGAVVIARKEEGPRSDAQEKSGETS